MDKDVRYKLTPKPNAAVLPSLPDTTVIIIKEISKIMIKKLAYASFGNSFNMTRGDLSGYCKKCDKNKQL